MQIISINRAQKRQITFNGEQVDTGSFGENLTTESPDLRALKIGDWLKAGEVPLEISAPRCNRHRSRGRTPATTKLSDARAPREAQSHHALP